MYIYVHMHSLITRVVPLCWHVTVVTQLGVWRRSSFTSCTIWDAVITSSGFDLATSTSGNRSHWKWITVNYKAACTTWHSIYWNYWWELNFVVGFYLAIVKADCQNAKYSCCTVLYPTWLEMLPNTQWEHLSNSIPEVYACISVCTEGLLNLIRYCAHTV